MGCSRVLVGLTCFLQVACAAAIITITAWKLHKVNLTWDSNKWNADVENTCLLGALENGGNLCYLAYGVGGIATLATAALSILQCCTCNLCGLGGFLDAAFAAAGAVVMGVAGWIFNTSRTSPAMQGAPRPEWRMSIPILCFAACALFGMMALAAVYSILSCCCCCCGSGGGRSQQQRTKVVYRDMEKGQQEQGQFMAR